MRKEADDARLKDSNRLPVAVAGIWPPLSTQHIEVTAHKRHLGQTP